MAKAKSAAKAKAAARHAPKALPRFVPPMLAVPGQPFDSEAHFFEFKWDGFRAIAMLDRGGFRLLSRNNVELTGRYPMLSALRALPPGMVLDGELVAFHNGKPSFEHMLSRRGLSLDAASIRFVAFDVLYKDYDSLMDRPFTDRRLLLEQIVEESNCPQLVLSEGVSGTGKALYHSACQQGLEGVMAKRLSSQYAAGKRNGAWIKIKRRLRIQVAIIGFIEKEGDDFQSLLVASSGLPGEEDGPLRFVGRVGSGFDTSAREALNALLRARPRAKPLAACPEPGRWVEPGLYCTVSFTELTAAGLMRAPVFEGMIEA